ncbi:MAG: response regulator [Desulfobulbaceae bacterium]|nr:response regulator [Desulfobulbaceae bacterium]
MAEAQIHTGNSRIMVVDDVPEILALLTTMLSRSGYQVVTCSSGAEALAEAEKNPPEVILLDILMPEMDGFQVCDHLQHNPKLKDIPVIFTSGLDDTENKVQAFRVGGVDYITKPFHLEELEARVWTQIRLQMLQKSLAAQKLNEEKIRALTLAQQATIFALAKLAEFRDEDTGKHLERVREYCRLLAEKLRESSSYSANISVDFVEHIYHASPLHDIGKVAIPDGILLKPGRLTTEEFAIIMKHPVVGGDYLQDVYNNYSSNVFIGMGIEIALYHHERWDGKGYPDGLIGTNIPLSARIMAVADCYDALRADRCYRKGFPHPKVKAMILEENGTHFDPEICRAFLALEAEFEMIMDTLG